MSRRRLRRQVAERAGAQPGCEFCLTCCAYCGVEASVVWRDGEEPTFYAGTYWVEDVQLAMDEPAHLDHVIPEHLNGPTSLDNTVIACAPCNLAKGASALGDPGFLRWLEQRRAMLAARDRRARILIGFLDVRRRVLGR